MLRLRSTTGKKKESHIIMATSSDYRIKLALTLIEEHFGEITKDVATALITTQSATLAQVVRICGQLTGVRHLSSKQVKEALLVLLHHNCLLVELAPEVKVEGDAPLVAADRLKPTGLIYRLCLETVINRIRLTKLASYAQSLFEEGIVGDIAAQVIEEFAIHGRRKLWQLRQDLSKKVRRHYHKDTISIISDQHTLSASSLDASSPQRSWTKKPRTLICIE